MKIKRRFIFIIIMGLCFLTACGNINGKKDIKFGNESAVLLKNGLYCKSDEKKFYVNASEELISETGTGSSKIYDGFVYGGLNYYQDRLYFIEKDSNNVFSMLEDGSDLKNEIDEKVYYFLICDEGMVYVNQKNQLCQKKGDEEVKIIEESIAIWENIYGECILYAKLSNDGCPVIAYNLRTEEREQILDYAFFPIIYGDELFFQGNDTYIYKFDLLKKETQKIAEVWGQNFVKLGDYLYFCGGNKIQYVNLTDNSITKIYDLKDTESVQEMWEQDGKLIFYVTEGEREDKKIYEEETGKVIDYE